MRVAISTAVSLNGVITPARGESSAALIPRLEVPAGVLEWQRAVRRRHDVVAVGTRTVIVDDPGLVSHAGPERPAVRATVDPAGKIPRSARFFDGSARTLVGITEATPAEYRRFLEERGVEAVVCGGEGTRADLRGFLAGLAERGLRKVVFEGGGTVNRALLAAGVVERLYLTLIPVVMDAGSVNLFEGAGGLARFGLEGMERVGDFLLLTYRGLRP